MKRRGLLKKYKAIMIFISIFLLFTFALYKIDKDFKPIIMALCDAEARIIATGTINETIRDEFGNKISYDDIMTIKTDKEGNIVMIQANTVELNRIGSQIALGIQNRIGKVGGMGVKIPIGIVLKNDLLAYYGPKVTFKMKPMGSTLTSYSSNFEAAGINQTRHIVYLNVTVTIQVIIPLARNSVSITSNIPIAESIIVGKVPNTYAEFGQNMDSNGLMLYQNQKKIEDTTKP
jgi:sporulation protein YunB